MESSEMFKPSKIESKAVNRWSTNSIYEKVKESRKGGRNYYLIRYPNIIDNDVKLTDVYRNILNDVWARFQSMRNYNVKSSIGLDPLNYYLEDRILKKNLIEGVDELTAKDIDAEELTDQIDTLEKRNKNDFTNYGLWFLDEDLYSTNKKEFLDSIWWTFKEIFKDDLVEERNEPLLWCPECGMPISGAEIDHEKDVVEKAIIKVPIHKEKRRYFLTEATNSWTIPSSPCLIVNPYAKYSVVKYRQYGRLEQSVVLDEKVEEIMEKGNVEKYEVTKTVPGSKLEDRKYYYPLMNKVPYHKKLEGEHVHKIISSDRIDPKGTGIFFFTPAHDKKHWKIAVEKDIDTYTPIEFTGKYDSDLRKTKYSGFPATNSDSMILNDLESQDNIFFRVVEDEKVKICSYCSNRLLWMPGQEFFFNSSEFEDDIKRELDGIHWIPKQKDLTERDTMKIEDWYISRKGIIGIPIPLWKCECGNTFIPEDRLDLSKISDYSKRKYPYSFIIDELDIQCDECGKYMNRVNKIFNPLFISSASPWAQLGYPRDKYGYQSWWPGKILYSNLGLDYTDIFTANISLSKHLFDESSVESLFIHGDIETELEKLPSDRIEDIGYDSLRLKLLSGKPPWNDRKLIEEDLKKPSKLIKVFWNLYNFTKENIKKHDFSPEEITLDLLQQNMPPEDEWLLSRLESVKKEMKNAFIDSRYDRAISILEEFLVDDIAQWYISV
ncbi:MAG: class I tRNA ligase family protein, partial [Thermoplasmatota archaeon]